MLQQQQQSKGDRKRLREMQEITERAVRIAGKICYNSFFANAKKSDAGHAGRTTAGASTAASSAAEEAEWGFDPSLNDDWTVSVGGKAAAKYVRITDASGSSLSASCIGATTGAISTSIPASDAAAAKKANPSDLVSGSKAVASAATTVQSAQDALRDYMQSCTLNSYVEIFARIVPQCSKSVYGKGNQHAGTGSDISKKQQATASAKDDSVVIRNIRVQECNSDRPYSISFLSLPSLTRKHVVLKAFSLKPLGSESVRLEAWKYLRMAQAQS
jgi:hypothetical protein